VFVLIVATWLPVIVRTVSVAFMGQK